jgi:MFS family permease
LSDVTTAPDEFAAGWKPLLAAAIATSFATTTLPFNILGAVILPLQHEFGWGRGDITLSYFFFTAISALSFPLVGRLIDRHGARPLALIGVPASALGLAGIALTGDSLPGFYVLWVLLGVLGAAASPVTYTRVVNEWFSRRRGLALALCLSLGGLVLTFQQVVSTLLVERYGWRTMFVVMAAIVLVVCWPPLYFFFRSPDRSADPARTAIDSAGFTLREVLRGLRFYALALGVVLVTLGISGVMINFKPILADAGIAPERAAWIAGAVGLAVVAGRLVTGLLVDRYWAPGVACVLLVLPAASCWILLPADLTVAMALTAGLLIGLATGAEGDLMPFLTVKYFGLRHYGRIYAVLLAVFFAASGIAPFLAGRVFDVFGSYQPALIAASAMFVVGAGLFLALGRYPADFGGANGSGNAIDGAAGDGRIVQRQAAP